MAPVEIIAPMVERLLEVGQRLKQSGECTYWSRGGEAGSVRFLTTPTAFCVVLEKPRDRLMTIQRVLPLRLQQQLGAGGMSLKWRTEEG
ncbi:hypothetical protein AURDEDRAFT_164082 [Auricularia subglabra TFB-10046 SS5]|nr:hypothetical protein AURDEDRAFT_164082 [Auricularia subglabra TFB-10046 SS5]